MIDACYLAAGKNKCTSAPGSVRQHLVLGSCGWPAGDGERAKESGETRSGREKMEFRETEKSKREKVKEEK